MINSYTSDQIEKIGNTIVYLISKLENPSKTRILKFLYILDELSIKKSGIPFLNLGYQVWKFGPVAKDIFVEFSSSPSMLKKFIDRESVKNHSYLTAKVEFSDDEFSENELELLEEVAEKYKSYSTEDLIKITHREKSPWRNAAIKYGVLEDLLGDKISSTDIPVIMTELIEYDEQKMGIYLDYLDFHPQVNTPAEILT